MLVIKREVTRDYHNINLINGSKIFGMKYLDNGDLYWNYFDGGSKSKYGAFEITKENYVVYHLFDNLYNKNHYLHSGPNPD